MVEAYLIHWNAPEWCRESVDSLTGTASVTVINNAGTLDLPDTTRVVDAGGNRGFAGGANLALSLASGEHVLVGCHDARFDAGSMAAMARMLDADPGLAIVGPAINGHGGTAADLEWISGTAMMFRAEVARAYRFDERFPSYAEDVDLCYRLRAAGWRIGRTAEANVTTKGSVDTRRAELLMQRNSLVVFARHRKWRWFGSRVLLLLRHPGHLHALVTGLARTVAFPFMRPDRITRRFI